LRVRLADARGLEDAIGVIRSTVRETDFAISVATLEGRLDADQAGMRRASLADAALAALLILIPILVPAAHVPNNHFKTLLGHPMVLGVLLWAFAHLLANGTLRAVVLFGAILLWAIVDFVAARRRDMLAKTTYPPANVARDGVVIVSGLVAWALFAFALHGWLFGVRPLG